MCPPFCRLHRNNEEQAGSKWPCHTRVTFVPQGSAALAAKSTAMHVVPKSQRRFRPLIRRSLTCLYVRVRVTDQRAAPGGDGGRLGCGSRISLRPLRYFARARRRGGW